MQLSLQTYLITPFYGWYYVYGPSLSSVYIYYFSVRSFHNHRYTRVTKKKKKSALCWLLCVTLTGYLVWQVFPASKILRYQVNFRSETQCKSGLVRSALGLQRCPWWWHHLNTMWSWSRFVPDCRHSDSYANWFNCQLFNVPCYRRRGVMVCERSRVVTWRMQF